MSPDSDLIRRLNCLKNKIFRPRLSSIFASTICFFCNDNEKKIVPAGSGVFLKYKESYYVVSAAHVLAEHYNETFVILDDEELRIGGRLVISPMPDSGLRGDDKVDIAVLRVDDRSRQALLSRFKAVEIQEIETKHKIRREAAYFSVGFPLTKTKKVWGKDEIRSIGYTYQTEPILDFNFAKFGFNKHTTIAMKFDGEVTSATNPHPHLAPDLKGISGSGLWHFYGQNKKSLIGIVIQRIKETGHKSVLATKIDVVIKMIDLMS